MASVIQKCDHVVLKKIVEEAKQNKCVLIFIFFESYIFENYFWCQVLVQCSLKRESNIFLFEVMQK